MTEPQAGEPVLGHTVTEAEADTATRDESGARYGGERLGRHPTPLVWFLMFVIVVGFVLGGVAIVVDSLWLFVAGVVVAAVGGIGSLGAGVMQMTE